MLYFVPTPIGNLKDMTYRGVEVLKSVDFILAEDTRVSGKLLKHFDIQTPMRAFHQHNEHKLTPEIIKYLKNGQDIGIITDAGTPGISDPGYLLARSCIDNSISISCLPGATAFVPALITSGLPNDRFVFEGFLPSKKGRQKRLLNLTKESKTMVFYESPYKLRKTLEDFKIYFGEERLVSIAREISKLYEEIKLDTIANHLAYYAAHQPKGEFVLIVNGNTSKK